MDILSVFGALLAALAIILGQTIDGGQYSSLLNMPAFLIVVGGSVGAIMVQVPMATFKHAIKMFHWVVIPPVDSMETTINKIVKWSDIARKEGILSLDRFARIEDDPYTNNALQLLIDGRTPEMIRRTLETEIDTREDFDLIAAKVYEAMGGYTPTLGILGAVMGLIHVMENLSEPSSLGQGIATAFVATVYGVGLANLFLIPVSKKLSHIVYKQTREREMILEGILCISDGENPRNVSIRLNSYLRNSYGA